MLALTLLQVGLTLQYCKDHSMSLPFTKNVSSLARGTKMQMALDESPGHSLMAIDKGNKPVQLISMRSDVKG